MRRNSAKLLTAALVKNKAEDVKLAEKLQKIELQRRTELRMLNNDKEKLRSKCFRKTVSSPTVVQNNSEIYSEQIHNLLFTNDEIDKEKILCLYLISAHRTETLAPQAKKIFHICKVHSPLESLLDRSKKKITTACNVETKLIHTLPIYTVELPGFEEFKDHDVKINDGRLATRILLNEKIRDLINAVLSALRQSNPQKFIRIVQIMNDPRKLEDIFNRKNVSDFLEELKNFSEINSCESFVLTPPYKTKSIQLEIKTKDGILEKYLKDIRQNLLQLPARRNLSRIKALGDFDSFSDEISFKSLNQSSSELRSFRKPMDVNQSQPKQIRETTVATNSNIDNQSNKRPSLNFELLRRRSSHKMPIKNFSTDTDQLFQNSSSSANYVKDINEKFRMTNFVKKNILDAGSMKKSSVLDADEDDELEKIEAIKRKNKIYSAALRRNSLKNYTDEYPMKLPLLVLKEKVIRNIGRYEENNINNLEIKAEHDNLKSCHCSKSSASANPVKFRIKQTTCPACMEKWRIPLPTPKTPRVKKNSLIPPNENPYLQDNSHCRYSVLIDKELFKLQSHGRSFRRMDLAKTVSRRKKALENAPADYINLSPIELAKIEQQVKEKETQKKLEYFLKT